MKTDLASQRHGGKHGLCAAPPGERVHPHARVQIYLTLTPVTRHRYKRTLHRGDAAAPGPRQGHQRGDVLCAPGRRVHAQEGQADQVAHAVRQQQRLGAAAGRHRALHQRRQVGVEAHLRRQ